MLILRNRRAFPDLDLLADLSGISGVMGLELLAAFHKLAVFLVLLVVFHEHDNGILHLVGDDRSLEHFSLC